MTASGEKLEQTLTLNKNKAKMNYSIDTVANNQIFFNKSYTVRGWILANRGIKNLELSVDNKIMKSNVLVNGKRADVQKNYPQYSQPLSGFSTALDFSQLSEGKHNLQIKVVFSDGTNTIINRAIVIKGMESKIYIDTLKSVTQVQNSVNVIGWALTNKNFETIKAYIDDKLVVAGLVNGLREDVYKLFPEFNNKRSGFNIKVDTSKLPMNKEVILKVIFATKDGKTTTKSYKLLKKSQPVHSSLDNLAEGQSVFAQGTNNVNGWAGGNSELISVEAFAGATSIGKTSEFYLRSDVKHAYPNNYYGAKGNGFTVKLDVDKLNSGKQKINFEYKFKDGSKATQSRTVLVNKLDDKFSFDATSIDSAKSTLNFRGWFLSSSKATSIAATLLYNGKKIATGNVTANLSRPDVVKVYPQYGASLPGYNGNINISSIQSGNYTLHLQITKQNGKVSNFEKNISIDKQPIKTSIDTPLPNSKIYNGNLEIRGWFFADEGISSVKCLVNGKEVVSTKTFERRSDVAKAFPSYNVQNAGFILSVANKAFKGGSNKVELIFTTQAGRSVKRTFNVMNNWTIVIDPGHGGFDPGATAPSIQEKNVNLSIAKRVEELLKLEGYTVIMTRTSDVRLGIDTVADLSTRVSIANKANADLFISIHHDSTTGTSAKGITVYYEDSTCVTSQSVDQKWRLAQSKQLATVINTEIIKRTSYVNRGVKTEDFHVMRNTLMPAILIEGGFITNPSEAASIKSADHQDKMAKGIKDAVNKYIGLFPSND